MKKKWHTKSVSDIFNELKTSDNGLDDQEAAARLNEYGPNVLPESKPDSYFIIFLRQFKSPLIYVLLGAGFLVFLMGEFVDSLVIAIVLIFNAIVGTIQEGKAQNTLLALKKFTWTNATVIREGNEITIPGNSIVPGDIIVLREGEKVPADARIISVNALKIDESALSGESLPVSKVPDIFEREFLPLTEQKNMVFKGTSVLSGSAKAVVVATGIRTEIGKIAKEIMAVDTEIPLKKNIRYLSRAIIIVVAILNIFLFLLGLFEGKSFKEMFSTLVSLSVSVIPEGLPIVMTLILAKGVWDMSKRNALVKKLQAVEALGQADIIAVDKTGTITKNELFVQKVFVNKKYFEVEGLGYEPKGKIKIGDQVIEPLNHEDLLFAVKNAVLCADARVFFSEQEKRWMIGGDPTEAALIILGQKIGFHKNILEKEASLIVEMPFDYNLRYRACLRRILGKPFFIIIGAPENILESCDKIWHLGKSYDLSKEEKNNLQEVFEKMSSDGLRVVALAIINNASENILNKQLKNATFVGFFGMKDSLRPEVADAMARANKAGVRVVMITGDYKITAIAIAKEAGIYKEGDVVITGTEIEKMSEQELFQKIKNVSVFARVSPAHKMKIIEAFKANKKTIAMTGDGVNDAPSLVSADLGVAMGKIGTEVAKEASDIVLLDDNFGSIISAIEEGRNIYRTIKKVILYLFSTSMGEVFTITAALLLSLPLPILPAQIIWLNFVTDGFLDVSLAMEPKEKDLLSKKFYKPKKFLLDGIMLQRMILMSLTMMFGSLLVFQKFLEYDLVKAQTMTLTVLAVFQWFNAWNCRSEDQSIFKTNLFSNKFLLGSTFIVIILQILAVYNTFFQKVLQTTPISLYDWLLCIVVAFSIVVIEEIRKLIFIFLKNKKIFINN